MDDEVVPTRLLLLLFVGFLLPMYGLAADRIALVYYGSVFGAVLFLVKYRWWWEPLESYVSTHDE